MGNPQNSWRKDKMCGDRKHVLNGTKVADDPIILDCKCFKVRQL